ncbi:MAG: hypothetical protein R3E64_16175 [Halioglobus sp.]
MTKLPRLFYFCFFLIAAGLCQAADDKAPATSDAMTDPATRQLPDWQLLEFEERAFWAVARSRLEIRPVADDPQQWELDVLNSVVDNSEQIIVRFDPASGRVITRSRLSRGKEQRLKTYQYEDDFVLRKRLVPDAQSAGTPEEWPVSNSQKVRYPDVDVTSAAFVTSPYVLVILAQRLQQLGDDQSLELLVHTDLNFYRVRMSSGNGVPIDVDYQISGGEHVSGKTDTTAVALHVTPAGTPQEDNDFSLFGLQGEIILFFDRSSGLPLQVRGSAPRIGSTNINLKSATLREPAP